MEFQQILKIFKLIDMESKSLNKILYIFLSILFLVPSCSKNNKLYDYSKSCKKTSNISLSKRIENYPFNISKKIIFISYQQNKLGVEGTELTNYLENLKFNKLIFNNSSTTNLWKIKSKSKASDW